MFKNDKNLFKVVQYKSNTLKSFVSEQITTPFIFSDNRLGEFDYAMLPRSVSWLDLHRNTNKLNSYFHKIIFSNFESQLFDMHRQHFFFGNSVANF